MRLAWTWWLAASGWAAAQTGVVEGHVFWEADGSPPRFWLTVELERGGKVRHRQTFSQGGRFAFRKVLAGSYVLRAHFREIVFVSDDVVVAAKGPNFAAVMLPKLRADIVPFATVSYDQLRQWASRESQKRFREAERRLEKGDAGGATALLQEILASTPSAEVLDLLGQLHLRQERQQEGREMLEQAIARDPKYLFPYSHLAMHLLTEGRHREAAAVARRALEVDRNWATGHLILGGALFRLGDLEGAERHARTAAEVVQQKLPEPLLLLAKVLRTKGDCGGAREYLKRYLALRTSARALEEMRESIRVIESCLAVIPGAEPRS